MKEKICKTCKWLDFDEIGDKYCVNADSEHCADWVEETDICERWEENGRHN